MVCPWFAPSNEIKSVHRLEAAPPKHTGERLERPSGVLVSHGAIAAVRVPPLANPPVKLVVSAGLPGAAHPAAHEVRFREVKIWGVARLQPFAHILGLRQLVRV